MTQREKKYIVCDFNVNLSIELNFRTDDVEYFHTLNNF